MSPRTISPCRRRRVDLGGDPASFVVDIPDDDDDDDQEVS